MGLGYRADFAHAAEETCEVLPLRGSASVFTRHRGFRLVAWGSVGCDGGSVLPVLVVVNHFLSGFATALGIVFKPSIA